MFQRDLSDGRVVVIVDFQHLAYKIAFGGAPSLSTTLVIDGQPQVVDTTIPAVAIKAIHNWAGKGLNPTAVCFDMKGSGKYRKAYMKEMAKIYHPSNSTEYKEGRGGYNEKFFTGINITANYLYRGGVSCYKSEGYEADDLIKACVDRAKVMYPTLPIHVITGDKDLIPLVDEQVSVFYKSVKTTYAVEKKWERRGYVQITPANYEEIMSGTTEFKTINVPYNTVLLAKMLRGDKSDKIPGKPDWKPRIYNTLLQLLQDDGYDIGNMFRYGKALRSYKYRDSGVLIPDELLASTPKENIVVDYSDPVELTQMLEILSHYVEQEDLDYIRYKYTGMNLNGAIPIVGMPGKFRVPAEVKTDINGYRAGELQAVVTELRINLPQ